MSPVKCRLTDGNGRLALACGGGVDGGHEDELAVGVILCLGVELLRELSLVSAVGFDVLLGDAKALGDLADGLHLRLLGDLNICQHDSYLPEFYLVLSVYHKFYDL